MNNTNDPNGIYTNTTTISFDNFTDGVYDVYIKGPVHLVRLFAGKQLTVGNNLLPLDQDGALLTADSNSDNKIEVQDYNQLIASFKCQWFPAVYQPSGKDCSSSAADADFDGKITIHDYAYLVSNYQKQGAQ
jgi:hypothetical protein